MNTSSNKESVSVFVCMAMYERESKRDRISKMDLLNMSNEGNELQLFALN